MIAWLAGFCRLSTTNSGAAAGSSRPLLSVGQSGWCGSQPTRAAAAWGGEWDNPTLAPGDPDLNGRLAVGAPDDVAELQGARLAGTQADVTQQPQDGRVADAGRSRQVGLT